jgi:hypothetical protein
LETRDGSLANSVSLPDVSKAKSNQQNPHLFVAAMEIYDVTPHVTETLIKVISQ